MVIKFNIQFTLLRHNLITLGLFPLCDRHHFLCRAFLPQKEPCIHQEANLHPSPPQVLNTLNLPPLSVAFPFIVFPRSRMTQCMALMLEPFLTMIFLVSLSINFLRISMLLSQYHLFLMPNHISFYDNHINYPFLNV